MFKGNQADILVVLVSNPNKEYSLSELAEVLAKKPGALQRAVNSLAARGFIVSCKKRNQRIIKMDDKNPFFKEIKAIIQKTQGVEAILRDLVIEINNIDIAFIYGSYAKDQMNFNSDIDIVFVVKDLNVEEFLLEKLAQIENKIQREINYKIYLKDEFLSKRKKHNVFLEEILSKKFIILKGEL